MRRPPGRERVGLDCGRRTPQLKRNPLDSYCGRCTTFPSTGIPLYLFPEDPPHSLDTDAQSYERLGLQWERYQVYLKSIGDRLPSGAAAFAQAEWHYNHQDRRCPHDAWLEELTMRERSVPEQPQERLLDISVRLLGAYHDGHLHLTYREVRSYRLDQPPFTWETGKIRRAHWDWLVDEVRLDESGSVVHEVRWSDSGVWAITCRDLDVEWILLSQ